MAEHRPHPYHSGMEVLAMHAASGRVHSRIHLHRAEEAGKSRQMTVCENRATRRRWLPIFHLVLVEIGRERRGGCRTLGREGATNEKSELIVGVGSPAVAISAKSFPCPMDWEFIEIASASGSQCSAGIPLGLLKKGDLQTVVEF